MNDPEKDEDEGDDLRGLEAFAEDNAENVGVVAETALAAPVEVTYNLAKEFPVLVQLVSIGVVWVLVWFITVAFAKWVLAIASHLTGVFVVIASIIDIFADIFQYIYKLIFPIVKFVACEFPLISEVIGPGRKDICSESSPGINTKVIPTDPDWWKTEAWQKMYELETTCVILDNGWEELKILPKLLFNDIMCPVLMHAKPVDAMHTFFYYTIGWMTFHQGEFTPAKGTGVDSPVQEATDALYGHRCEPPPDAVFCFMMGVGFLILEILVPVMILFLIIHPLKPAIFAGTRIGVEAAKDGSLLSIYVVEKTATVTEWAGPRFGWLAALVVTGCFGLLFGSVFLGPVGFIIGGLVGVSCGAAVLFSSIGTGRAARGPSGLVVAGTAIVFAGLAAGLGALVGFEHNGTTALV